MDLLAHYVAHTIGFLLMVWGRSVSELQLCLSSLYYCLCQIIFFWNSSRFEYAPFGQAKVCLPEE